MTLETAPSPAPRGLGDVSLRPTRDASSSARANASTASSSEPTARSPRAHDAPASRAPVAAAAEPSVRDIARESAERAGARLRAAMEVQARREAEMQAETLEDQHRRVVTYLAVNPAAGPALRASDRIEAMLHNMPNVREAVTRSTALMRLMQSDRGLSRLLTTMERGGVDIAELAMNHVECEKKTLEEYAEEAKILELARGELMQYQTRVEPPTPTEPTEAESERYLDSLKRGGENEASPSIVDVYFRAHASNCDVFIPFTMLLVIAGLAALGMPAHYWLFSVVVAVAWFVAAARHAMSQPTYGRGTPLVSVSMAMWVHALLVVTALQFFVVYFRMFFWQTPLTCVVTGAAFIITPWLFYKTYALGPGYLPTAASDFSSWSATMERVGATQGGKTPSENASLMMQNNRYCQTCHCARPLRSKHCPFCKRCVSKMDHHCPITMTCIGANNQRMFLSATSTMLLGQLGFLRCSYKYYRELVAFEAPRVGGEGFVPGVITRFYVFTDAPFGMTLFALQTFLALYCFMIVSRMALGVAANLTVNEMENAARYEYLKSDDPKRPFRNVFDAGPRINCLHFWRNVDVKRDWDGFYAAAKEDRADLPIAPRLSYTWFQTRGPKFLRGFCRLHSDRAHGHGHSHGAHGHSHSGSGHGRQEPACAAHGNGHNHSHSHGDCEV